MTKNAQHETFAARRTPAMHGEERRQTNMMKAATSLMLAGEMTYRSRPRCSRENVPITKAKGVEKNGWS